MSVPDFGEQQPSCSVHGEAVSSESRDKVNAHSEPQELGELQEVSESQDLGELQEVSAMTFSGEVAYTRLMDDESEDSEIVRVSLSETGGFQNLVQLRIFEVFISEYSTPLNIKEHKHPKKAPY